jgi:hypothetical protein
LFIQVWLRFARRLVQRLSATARSVQGAMGSRLAQVGNS